MSYLASLRALITGSSPRTWNHRWVPGLTIAHEHTFVHALADLLRGAKTRTPAEPTFRTALSTQRVCAAILQSAKDRTWVETAAPG
jgi:predicted dehydrogenase